MNQTLVIGSTVIDVLIKLPVLPRQGDDINITACEYRIGGCAYNVYKMLRLFNSPALLCSPVGTGKYAQMVREQFEKDKLCPFAVLEKENGCCYCLIEPTGERTFLSYHGAEYTFSRSWMEKIDYSQIGGVYISGIDIEEPTGDEIIEFVYEHPSLELFFSVGPRIKHIHPEKLERLLCRRDMSGKGPFLHLNENEILSFSGKNGVKEGAEFLAEKTENSIVVTLGERGCYCLEWTGGDRADRDRIGDRWHCINGFPAQVIDTVGAGDAHFGTIIACLKEGISLEEACLQANRIGAAVVGISGAILNKLPCF